MIGTISEERYASDVPHRCAECNRQIPAGTIHVSQVNTDGTQKWTYRSHVDCHAMSNEFRTLNKVWNDDWLALYEFFDDKSELMGWRGFYPHVACRIAFTQRFT